MTAAAQGRLAKGTPPDLCDDMAALLKDDLDVYFGAFKTSKYMELCTRHMSAANICGAAVIHADDEERLRAVGLLCSPCSRVAVRRCTRALDGAALRDGG